MKEKTCGRSTKLNQIQNSKRGAGLNEIQTQRRSTELNEIKNS